MHYMLCNGHWRTTGTQPFALSDSFWWLRWHLFLFLPAVTSLLAAVVTTAVSHVFLRFWALHSSSELALQRLSSSGAHSELFFRACSAVGFLCAYFGAGFFCRLNAYSAPSTMVSVTTSTIL